MLLLRYTNMFFFTGDDAVVVASVVSVAAVVLLWVESTFEPTLGRILMGEVRMEGKTTDGLTQQSLSTPSSS